MFFLTCHTRSSDDTGLAWWLDSGHSSGLLQDNSYLVNGQFPHRKCKQDKLIHIWTRTSGSCAGVQRQTCGSSPQDLLLGLGPLFLLVALFLSLGQAELEWGKEKQQETNSSSWLYVNKAGLFWSIWSLYLFGGVGRLGEDGLPVWPHKHDEREVEEDQVDNWRETSSRASGPTTACTHWHVK